MVEPRPPLPPFTPETAAQKVQAAEDAWNTRDPEKVALAYTVDTVWRNRDEWVTGRDEVIGFLTRKWERGAHDSSCSRRQNTPPRDGFRTIHAPSLKTGKGNTPAIALFGPKSANPAPCMS